jgi:hypothetical protein
MTNRIFEGVTVTIDGPKKTNKIWLEETLNDKGKVIKYKVCKNTEYKLPPLSDNEIKQ